MIKSNAIELSDALLNGHVEKHVIMESVFKLCECMQIAQNALQSLVRWYEDPTDNSNWIDEWKTAQIILDCSTRY